MKLLDELTVYFNGQPRRIELYHGDLTNIPPEHAVDVLVVSAFPGNYAARGRTLIGRLADKGVRVRDLAGDKLIDLRENFSCWMSKTIENPPDGIQFARILCFEASERGEPPELIGDIFQSLIAVATGEKVVVNTVAMPPVATGNQGYALADIIEPLIEAAVHWLQIGLPVQTLKIVEFQELKAYELKGVFSILKRRIGKIAEAQNRYKYDLFVSYSHENALDVAYVVDELKRLQPRIRIFVDRQELNAGHAWQQEIYDALENCHKVLAFYSPTYLNSKVCREEFNIAMFRHRDSEDGTLIPIYLYSTNLPSYMQIVQFIDCREADQDKLKAACAEIVQAL